MNEYLDRLTETSREVLDLAHEEAQNSPKGCIGTKHLLLGLLRRGDGNGMKVLASFNIEHKQLMSIMEQDTGSNEQLQECLHGLTLQAREALAFAEEEARLLGFHYIGTGHLLLGLIRQGNGTAARALAAVGVSLDVARRRTVELTVI